MSNLMLDVDQAGELKAAFRRGDKWTNADIKKLCEGNILEQVWEVLNGRAEITIVRRVLTLATVFNPAEFEGLGQGWTIWKGPADGDGLTGDEDRDTREDALTEVDLVNLVLESCLKTGETSIKGEEKLRRLKEGGKIRLAGKTFLSLWRDYQEKGADSLLEYLYKTREVRYLDFFGLVLRTPRGHRSLLYLYRDDGGRWRWTYRWLGFGWPAVGLAALLAK